MEVNGFVHHSSVVGPILWCHYEWKSERVFVYKYDSTIFCSFEFSHRFLVLHLFRVRYGQIVLHRSAVRVVCYSKSIVNLNIKDYNKGRGLFWSKIGPYKNESISFWKWCESLKNWKFSIKERNSDLRLWWKLTFFFDTSHIGETMFWWHSFSQVLHSKNPSWIRTILFDVVFFALQESLKFSMKKPWHKMPPDWKLSKTRLCRY